MRAKQSQRSPSQNKRQGGTKTKTTSFDTQQPIVIHKRKASSSSNTAHIKIRQNPKGSRHNKTNSKGPNKKLKRNESAVTKSINFELDAYKKYLKISNSKSKTERSATQLKKKKRHQTQYNINLKHDGNKNKRQRSTLKAKSYK